LCSDFFIFFAFFAFFSLISAGAYDNMQLPSPTVTKCVMVVLTHVFRQSARKEEHGGVDKYYFLKTAIPAGRDAMFKKQYRYIEQA